MTGLERQWRQALARRVWAILPAHVQLRILGTVSEHGERWAELQTTAGHKAADRFLLEHEFAERIGKRGEWVVLTGFGVELYRQGVRSL